MDRTKVEKNKKILIVVLLVSLVLRVWRISSQPSGLMFDEVELGYQTYSLIKTGKDYFGNSLPIHFESLADAKSPLYIYTSVPTVLAFGLTPLGVRLPSVFFGVLGVLAFYLLVKTMFKSEKISLIAAALLAISPWHIQYSRGAYEVNIMLTLFLFGLYFFLKGLDKPKNLTYSGVLLALTPWAYSTAKLLLPLVVLILLSVWWKKLLKVDRRKFVLSAFFFFLVVAPIVYSTVFQGGVDRFSYVSIFGDPTVEGQVGYKRLEDARIRDGEVSVGLQPTLIDRLFHNKFTVWANALTTNYFENFSTRFLFVEGDGNLRHSVNGVGQLYRVDLILVFFGLVVLFSGRLDKRVKIFVALWLLVGPLPASLTADGAGHATRSIFMLPPLLILAAYGMDLAFKRKYLAFALVGLYIVNFFLYQKVYWTDYKVKSEDYWYVGFEELVEKVGRNEKERVVVSMAQEPTHLFFVFWNQVDPKVVQETNIKETNAVLAGFGEVVQIGEYYFTPLKKDIDPADVLSGVDENTLYVAYADEELGLEVVDNVLLPSGRERFRLYAR